MLVRKGIRMSDVSVNNFTLQPVCGKRSEVESRPEPKQDVAVENPPMDTYVKAPPRKLQLGHSRTNFAATGPFADTWGMYGSY